MNKPRTDQSGSVDLSSFAELSYEELRAWVRDRLHGRDLALGAGHDDLPHFLIATVYPNLNRSTRRDLQAAVIEFVGDLAHNPPTEWSGESGSELLMLADPVLLDADNREQIVDDFRKIADSRGGDKPDLRFRALQALITLRHRANQQYWQHQYEMGGQAYLPVVLEGLSLIDVSAPIRWLKEVAWSRAVERSFIGLLPSLLEEYGAAKVTRLLSEVLPDLPKRGQDSILQFCNDETLTLERLADKAQTPGGFHAEAETRIRWLGVDQSRVPGSSMSRVFHGRAQADPSRGSVMSELTPPLLSGATISYAVNTCEQGQPTWAVPLSRCA
jgi:hypothetical protein